MPDYTPLDLVAFAHDQRPLEFEQAFNALLTDRIAAAVEDRKLDIAQTTFQPAQEIEEPEVEVSSEELPEEVEETPET